MAVIHRLFFIFILFGFSTCSQSDRVDKSDIAGHWQLKFALVNGENTDRLRDLFLDFNADQQLITNIFGESNSYGYEFSEGEIRQQSDPELIYYIQELSDSLMVLQTNIRKADFILHFYKVSQDANDDHTNTMGK